MKFQNRQDLDQARAAYKKALDLETKKILICAGTGCVAGGSLKIYDRFLELMKERNIRCEVRLEKEPHDESIGLKKSGCHGFCEMGPLVRLEPGGYLYIKVKPEDCEEILENVNDYMGPVFEKICEQYLIRAARAKKLPFIPYKMGKWWGNNPLIKAQDDVDILAFDKTGKKVLLCECKFRNKPMPMEEYDDLVMAAEMFKNAEEKYLMFFSKSGFTESVKERAARENAVLLTIEDLY